MIDIDNEWLSVVTAQRFLTRDSKYKYTYKILEWLGYTFQLSPCVPQGLGIGCIWNKIPVLPNVLFYM